MEWLAEGLMLPPLCCQNLQVMHAKSTPKELVMQMALAQNLRRYNSDDADIYVRFRFKIGPRWFRSCGWLISASQWQPQGIAFGDRLVAD